MLYIEDFARPMDRLKVCDILVQSGYHPIHLTNDVIYRDGDYRVKGFYVSQAGGLSLSVIQIEQLAADKWKIVYLHQMGGIPVSWICGLLCCCYFCDKNGHECGLICTTFPDKIVLPGTLEMATAIEVVQQSSTNEYDEGKRLLS